MARDTVIPRRETEDDDGAIRTVKASSSPCSQAFDYKFQKEITSPVTVTRVPSSSDTISDAEVQGAQTGKQKRTEVLQLMALYWSFFGVGCIDGSNGSLLPRIQQVYQASGSQSRLRVILTPLTRSDLPSSR